MQRCTGPCGRLLLAAVDFPRLGRGRCWDCFNGEEPRNEGLDRRPTKKAADDPSGPPRRRGRAVGF